MSFAVSADAYGRFMGVYSERLAAAFADVAGVRPGQRALDVGCGPGAMAAELVRRLGPGAVCAAEPSPSFMAAARERLPGVDVRQAAAEDLPFPDGAFDVTVAQLVVHFMADPVAGLREMARVTRPGGTVAACLWDSGGGRSPTSPFWRSARRIDPAAPDDRKQAGTTDGHLISLFAQAGLDGADASSLSVTVVYPTFDHWWETFTLGVGPVGDYLAGLDGERRRALREACRSELDAEPVEVTAAVWAVHCRV